MVARAIGGQFLAFQRQETDCWPCGARFYWLITVPFPTFGVVFGNLLSGMQCLHNFFPCVKVNHCIVCCTVGSSKVINDAKDERLNGGFSSKAFIKKYSSKVLIFKNMYLL